MSHEVFICHSTKDRAIADAVASTLERHGIRCWIAPRDVLPGSDYAESIVEAISSTRLTLLVFSDSANHSGHVRREIERSVGHGVPILPFRVEDVAPSPSLEYFISDAHWLDAMTPPLEQHLDRLAQTVPLLLDVGTPLGRPVPTATPAAASARPPTAAPSPTAPPQRRVPTSPPTTPAGARRRRLPWLVTGAVAIVAALVVGAVIWRGALGGPETGPAASPTSTSTNLSASPTTSPAPGATSEFTDEFDGSLQPGWTWVNEEPAQWSLDALGDWLQITAQPSPPIRNLLLRDATAWSGSEYLVQTFVRFAPKANFQFAGLVITGSDPDRDRMQFGRAFCDEPDCVGDGLYFERIENGSAVGDTFAFTLPADVVDVDLVLNVTRTGLVAMYSLDNGRTWQTLGEHPLDPGYSRVGLVAHQAPTPVKAAFSVFLIYPA